MHDRNEARVQIVAEGQAVTLDVIVLEDDAPAILLGKDNPKARALLANRVDKKADSVPSLVRAITRAQDKVQQMERVVDSVADARDGALPKLPGTMVTASTPQDIQMPQLDVIEEGTSREGVEVDMGEIVHEQVEVQGDAEFGDEAELVEAEVEEVTALAGTMEADSLVGLNEEDMAVCAQPLLTLTKGEDAARALAREQRVDDSLFEWRKKAEKMEDGYVLEKHDVLVQVKEVVPGRETKCLCVPRRRDLLEVAHKSLFSGHFSHNKMAECLLAHYTWPGLCTQVRRYCAECPDCQRAGRILPPKVPMEKPPVISALYHRLACDLVGPLTRTKAGYRYILTVICLDPLPICDPPQAGRCRISG